MSDTPKTDAVISDHKFTILGHAQKLERELNETLDCLLRCLVWLEDGFSEAERKDARKEALEILSKHEYK